MLHSLQGAIAKKVVCIDPGLRHLAVSFFENGILRTAFLLANTENKKRGAPAWLAMAAVLRRSLAPADYDLMVIERPKQYEGGKNKGRRSDLMELIAVVAACAMVSKAPVVDIYPRMWKGQAPKNVTAYRLLGSELAASKVGAPRLPRIVPAELSPAELACITWPSRGLAHNVVDAIGIGAWVCGRYGPA